MQTSAHPTPQADLLELALEACEARQRAERQRIVSYAPTFAGIHATLDALHAAGLLILTQDVRFMPPPVSPTQPPEIMVIAQAAAGVQGMATHRLEEARFALQATGNATPVTVWRHDDGWLLLITWAGDADVCTASMVERLAA